MQDGALLGRPRYETLLNHLLQLVLCETATRSANTAHALAHSQRTRTLALDLAAHAHGLREDAGRWREGRIRHGDRRGGAARHAERIELECFRLRSVVVVVIRVTRDRCPPRGPPHLAHHSERIRHHSLRLDDAQRVRRHGRCCSGRSDRLGLGTLGRPATRANQHKHDNTLVHTYLAGETSPPSVRTVMVFMAFSSTSSGCMARLSVPTKTPALRSAS